MPAPTSSAPGSPMPWRRWRTPRPSRRWRTSSTTPAATPTPATPCRPGTRVLVHTNSTSTAAGLVVWHANGTLVKVDRGRHLVLHAAGVQRSGITVALPAPWSRGKTTTCAGLLRAGFSYLTDEALVLDRTDGSITPFPKALSLDQGSRQALGALAAPPYPNAEADDQWQVPWWELGSPGMGDGSPIDVVVLPAFRHGSDTVLEAVGPGEALLAFADSTFEFRRRPRANLDLLAALVETRPGLPAAGSVSSPRPWPWLESRLVDSLAGDRSTAHGRTASVLSTSTTPTGPYAGSRWSLSLTRPPSTTDARTGCTGSTRSRPWCGRGSTASRRCAGCPSSWRRRTAPRSSR